MKKHVIWGSSFVVAALALSGCAVEPGEEGAAASQDDAVTAKIPAGWDKRCVVIAPDGVNVRESGSTTGKVLYTAQCHEWFYPQSEMNGWTKVNKLPKGAEAGVKVDERFAAGFVKSQYLNCFDKDSGIDPGVWVNSVPACGPTGIVIQNVNKDAVKADAKKGVSAPDAAFSEAYLNQKADGFSFWGRTSTAGTVICSYATSRESGVVAQAQVGAGGEFYCQVANKPGAKFYYWFK